MREYKVLHVCILSSAYTLHPMFCVAYFSKVSNTSITCNRDFWSMRNSYNREVRADRRIDGACKRQEHQRPTDNCEIVSTGSFGKSLPAEHTGCEPYCKYIRQAVAMMTLLSHLHGLQVAL